MTDSNSDVTSFHNRGVLIIGETSGMGLATARLLLEAGAAIVITGRDGARLDRAAEELDKMSDQGARLFTVRADSASLTDFISECGDLTQINHRGRTPRGRCHLRQCWSARNWPRLLKINPQRSIR
ncbi:SDR family NAD(P)-dependent oxidoreductase [Streptomyces sp. NPDC001492]